MLLLGGPSCPLSVLWGFLRLAVGLGRVGGALFALTLARLPQFLSAPTLPSVPEGLPATPFLQVEFPQPFGRFSLFAVPLFLLSP